MTPITDMIINSHQRFLTRSKLPSKTWAIGVAQVEWWAKLVDFTRLLRSHRCGRKAWRAGCLDLLKSIWCLNTSRHKHKKWNVRLRHLGQLGGIIQLRWKNFFQDQTKANYSILTLRSVQLPIKSMKSKLIYQKLNSSIQERSWNVRIKWSLIWISSWNRLRRSTQNKHKTIWTRISKWTQNCEITSKVAKSKKIGWLNLVNHVSWKI